jgi:hypothetical protein
MTLKPGLYGKPECVVLEKYGEDQLGPWDEK